MQVFILTFAKEKIIISPFIDNLRLLSLIAKPLRIIKFVFFERVVISKKQIIEFLFKLDTIQII